MVYRCQGPVTGLLPAVRLLYLVVQVLRLEAIVLHLEGKCLSGPGVAVLILGLVLGLGSHIVSIAMIARAHATMASTARQSMPTRKSTDDATAGSFQGASPPWLQPLVVPLSMAGLVLELLSGAPPAALTHSRTLAVMLLLSIALQRDPLWEALPQLAAALALDFAAFLAASLTGLYSTPQAVVQHLLSTTVAAMAVIALTPLFNSLMPMNMATPAAHQQQQQGRLAARQLITEIGDPTVLEQPLAGLPQDVIQVSERRLLRTYRRKLCCERVASALLVLIGAVRGPTVRYHIAMATSSALAADAAGAILPPLLRARAAAASLALITSSTLLLLNGLLAQLPGRLYDEHSAPINSIVTALHALGHVMHVLAFAPTQRSRALLVRMMAALTSNLIANEDPWIAFLAQLLALLGLVTALDVRVGWKATAGGGSEEAQNGRRMDQRQTFADAVETDGGCAESLGTNVRPRLLREPVLPFQRPRVALGWSYANVDAATCTANDNGYGTSHIMASPSLLPAFCYALIAAMGGALCFSVARGKYLHFYRLYRKFYLPPSYGGMCVTAPLPHDDVLQLRDDRVLDSTPVSESNASSATLKAAYSPPRPSVDASTRSLASHDSSRWGRARRSVSLNAFMGTGDIGISRGHNAAGATPNANSGHSHSLLVGTATASTLSSMASERITTAALDVGAYGDRPPPLQSMPSPFTSSPVARLEQKGTGGSGGGIAPVSGVGEVQHASQATAADDGGTTTPASELDGPRPILASALELDEADVISGKINVTRQLSKLAARGGNSMGARELDRLMQSMETNNATSSSANTSGLGGLGLGGNNPMGGSAAGIGAGPGHGHGHPPTRSLPPRRSSDISYHYGSAAQAHAVRLTTPGGATASGATAGGSFLESVAASLASEQFTAAGGASAGQAYGGLGVPSGGQHQRVNRLRAAPARASSDLAGGRRSLHMPVATQNQPQPPSPYTLQLLQPHAALAQHRLPRRSPSDVSHLTPRYHRSAKSLAGHLGTQAPPLAASSRYGQGAAVSPSGQRAGATGAQASGAGTATTMHHPPGVWVATATGTPGGANYGYGGGLRAASFNAAMSPGWAPLGAPGMRGYVPQRRGPSRQPSRQYTAMIDSTGLTLLGQNLITIGGSSGGPNHVILSSLHSPNVSGVNAVTGISGGAHAATIPAAVFSGESNAMPEVMSLWEGPGGAVSSLEPVRGLRPNRGQRRVDSFSSTAGTPTDDASRTVAFLLAGGGGVPSAIGAAPLNSPKSAAPWSDAVTAAPAATGVPGAMPSVGGSIITANVQVSTAGFDASGNATRSSSPHTPTSIRLSAPVPWQRQEQHQQQQQVSLLPTQSEPPARPDTEHHFFGSLSFRRDCHDALVPHGSTVGDNGNGAATTGGAADTTSIRSRVRVSWSDMDARGSGGSTNTILTTASEASKTSAGTDPIADVFSVRWPRADSGTGSGSGAGTAEAPAPLAPARQVGSSRAASGAGPALQISATAPPAAIAPVTEGPAPSPVGTVTQQQQQQQQQLRNPPVHQHRLGPKTHLHQYDTHLAHRQSGGGVTSIAAQPHPTGMLYCDGPRGSGEQSDTSMEHVRAARELAAMWTSSSMGDTSSQMVPSNQSSVATGTPSPHGAAAFAAASLAGRLGATMATSTLAPYDGAARGLSAVQEASESGMGPSVVAERIRSTRHRRLSQVISPGQLVDVSRSGGRAVQPQQLQQRLRDLEPLPALALSGDGAADSASVQSSGGSGVMLSGPMAAAALAAQMSHAAGGGSVSSLAGAASTAMSFDNWATADDLAAMLLGPAGVGAGAGVGDLSAPYSPAGSSSRRSLALQASRLAAPSLPLEQQTSGPDEATQQDHPTHAGRGNGLGAPRVPQRIPSAPGPICNSSDGSGGLDGGTNGGGSSKVADISVVMDRIAGTNRSGPLDAAAAASGRSGVMTMRRGLGNTVATLGAASGSTLRHATQLAWAEADRVMPLRSPSVPNMGRSVGRGLHSGSVRRTSSMGKSRLGSMSSVSSSTLGFLNTFNTAFAGSPTLGTAAPAASQNIGQIPAANTHPKLMSPTEAPAAAAESTAAVGGRDGSPHTAVHRSTPQLLLRSTFGQMLDSDLGPGPLASASPSGSEGGTMDSYAYLPPMRASQTQLALLLPASSLRSVAGRPRGGGGGGFSAVGGIGGGGSIARGLAAAGATVSGPVGCIQDATMQAPVRGAPFRRSSLDERLFKQVVTARLLNMPARSRGRRRSVGSLNPLEYIPSRLSQDGKAVRAAAQAASSGPAASSAPSSTEASGRASVAQVLGLVADSGIRPHHLRSLGAIPELHVQGWDVAQGPGPGAGATLSAAQVAQAPAATPDNHRSSVAGSTATAITASSTSLQSFADVALGGIHHY